MPERSLEAFDFKGPKPPFQHHHFGDQGRISFHACQSEQHGIRIRAFCGR